ncbi:guanylate kinase [Aspergillus niger]|nr:uncharacterized protein AlacWU_07839 [Aspergillus niger]GKZ93805.1 guanylate kinase [Aspergillus niger]
MVYIAKEAIIFFVILGCVVVSVFGYSIHYLMTNGFYGEERNLDFPPEQRIYMRQLRLRDLHWMARDHAPRANEIHEKDYFFVDSPIFNTLNSQGAFVENATFSGYQYGKSRRAIADQLDKGLIPVLDIDVQGARHMKAESSGVEARYVFIRPPSFEVLERLRGRGTEREEDVRRRLERARAEAEGAVEGGLYERLL